MSNSLQHKIYQYEAKPPEEVWEKIEDSLAHQDYGFVARLAGFEEAPPETAWDKLSRAISADVSDHKQQKGVIRSSYFLRYAVAASVLLLVTVGFIWKFSEKEAGNDVALERPDVLNTNSTLKTPEDDSIDGNSFPITKTQSKKTVAADDTRVVLQKEQSDGRYLTVADDEGKKVRLSKKVMSVFDCAENVAAANSNRCKENIKSLQQKMSASLVSPSGDFAGLVDMIKILEENNN